MRFVLLFLFCLATAPPIYAKPGDKQPTEAEKSTKPAIKRQLRSSDIPSAPEGFGINKRALHFGKIEALAVMGDDVFVADAAQDRILRLRSRTDDIRFETRAEFLIGFNGLSDIAATNTHLFMADRAGVWKIAPGQNLVATRAPEFIFQRPTARKLSPIDLAATPDGKTLYIGVGNAVVSYGIESRTQKTVSRLQGEIQELAVSPNGSLWAGISKDGKSFIVPVRDGSEQLVHLELPTSTHLEDMGFWPSETFPEDWPNEWKSDLLIAMAGNQPMIARAHFNFGDISPDHTAFIDGFSSPSRIVGRREYWGVPSALAVLSNGQLIFALKDQGMIWVIEKSEVKIEPAKPEPTPDLETAPEPEKKDKSFFPDLLRGSSIGAASGLETDELLKGSKKDPEKTDDKNG